MAQVPGRSGSVSDRIAQFGINAALLLKLSHERLQILEPCVSSLLIKAIEDSAEVGETRLSFNVLRDFP